MTRSEFNMRGLAIDMEGNLSTVEWKSGHTLKVLQRTVEGLVDVVALGEDDCIVDMWINDEGLYTHEVNYMATHVADTLRGEHYQNYHGPVVFTGGIDEEGDTKPLSAVAEEKIRQIVSEAAIRTDNVHTSVAGEGEPWTK